ncbi:MAG: ornithine carbamoyltransferase [Moraxellaceae bacterium]|nr:ornithine carbamoyltransferase [Pseudobdellovibrionaceae bacterium]
MKTKHFLTGEELSVVELGDLLDLAITLKKDRRGQALANKTIGLLFEKPSLRTRVSFTAGVLEMSGNVIEINSVLRKKEKPEHTIKVLQGYLDGLMVRTFEHEILEEMVQFSQIPIINGLSDLHHPCQVLADLMTLKEKYGKLQGLKLAYIGDGNNMLHSLLLLLPPLGIDVHYACPEKFQPDSEIIHRAKSRATPAGAKIIEFQKPAKAVKDVHAVYTDVWASMGFEKTKDEEAVHLKNFEGFQINAELFSHAHKDAIIMHCMPINIDQEISKAMIDHPQAVLFAQSENRLHAQKALMMGLFNERNL